MSRLIDGNPVSPRSAAWSLGSLPLASPALRGLCFCLALSILAGSSLLDAAEQGASPAATLERLELVCLGAVSQDAVVERLADLETAIWGQAQYGTIPQRIAALQDEVLGNGARNPSLSLRINGIEWALYHRLSDLPLAAKMTALETAVLNQPATGPLLKRLEPLSAEFWPEIKMPVARMDLTAGTLVRIKLLTSLSSTSNKPGDVFLFAVAENVYQDGLPAIPAGATGRGRIIRVEPPRNMGRDAQITMEFGPVSTLDGTEIAIAAGEESVAANKSHDLTVRVTTAGMIVLGPAGILSGILLRGQEVQLDAGMQFYVQTTASAAFLTLDRGD